MMPVRLLWWVLHYLTLRWVVQHPPDSGGAGYTRGGLHAVGGDQQVLEAAAVVGVEEGRLDAGGER